MHLSNETLTTVSDIAGIIGNLATAIGALGIVLAAAGLRYQVQATHRAFEDSFGQRYHQMRTGWSPELRTKSELQEEDRKAIKDYIHLASSECEARAMGRVTDSTWRSWRRAIRHELFRSPTDNFHTVFTQAISGPGNEEKYKPLQDLLAIDGDEQRKPYRSPMSYDPNTSSRVRRWLSGL